MSQSTQVNNSLKDVGVSDVNESGREQVTGYHHLVLIQLNLQHYCTAL